MYHHSESSSVTLDDLRCKKVLLRTDFNVPIIDGIIQDISKIKRHSQTIDFLKKAGAKIIVISHLGRPSEPNQEYSLKILKDAIAREYNLNVIFVDDCINDEIGKIIDSSGDNDLILLENLRFHCEEKNCDFDFAKKLASFADFYVNDAFSASHRKHASICIIPQLLPHAFGFSFKNELNMLNYFFSNAKSPKMSIIGGSKLSTKIKLLKNLTRKVDKLVLGGGIAGVFVAFQNKIPLKIFEQNNYADCVAGILNSAEKNHCELVLPVDFSALVSSRRLSEAVMCIETGACDKCQTIESTILDIGPDSVELFKKHLKESATVLWNGPLGLFEKAPFDFGTRSVAEEMARLSREGRLVSIVGGGETAFAMNKFNVADDITHLSTSGGSFLSYLEESELPGITAMANAFSLPCS
ncbi:MAG: phosphoglycerate kinase [Holosporaceae bacterium]|jgi:phosphoglycerate kinase|nr:phosphoglycerate kinase [Holosporaceae bacterium]